MKWMTESERMIRCLEGHDWWQRHPKHLRETVRERAEAFAEKEGKNVYQQHVLRAAADTAEEINNAAYVRRQG